MKVQVTSKLEVYVTMEVDVPDTNEETLENAMNEVIDDCSYSFNHVNIKDSDIVAQEMSSHTTLG